ncbi:MAG: C1 family peptidase [Solobacterium sp.]|nr:C1 family peptidase [Solobacterium sp.]
MKKMSAVSAADLDRMKKAYLQNEKARVVRNALTTNDIASISRVLEASAASPNMFSIDIKTMPVTNQMQSGRCWIFSALNVLREMMAKKYHIDKFEFSQNYIAFYDKLEKVNFFMEAVLQEIDTPMNNEVMRWLLETAVGDGGQWDMFVSLVKKYGLCPKTAMPETYQSSHTRAMNGILNGRVRKFAADVKKAHAAGDDKAVAGLKKECLQECYGLICDCFGLPPEKFTFEYCDSRKKYHAFFDVTPAELYEKYLQVDLDDYVGFIHAPTADKPYHQMYTVRYLGNVVSGNPISFLNLPLDEFKELILKQLRAGEPVWFGCDCGKDGNRETGLWDDGQFDYEHTLDMHLQMSKEDMLDTRHSAMNHAMVFTGVNLVDDKPNRWKIENSWGEKVANDGYYICTDTWFDKYVYEAVVNRKYLSREHKKVLKQKPTVLDPWDPFGSLAD